MTKEKKNILFVDDEEFLSRSYVEALEDAGFEVTFAKTANDAIKSAKLQQFDLIIVDIMMAPGTRFSAIETAGGYKTGITLARELRDMLPLAPIIALTNSRDPEVQSWFSQNDTLAYMQRSNSLPQDVCKQVKKMLGERVLPTIFIVHGRDHTTLKKLRTLIKDDLKLGEAIVLSEVPSKGKTLIEKFELAAAQADVVFVLATPDEEAQLIDDPKSKSPRPRPNVLFEFGYFLGSLRRLTGRVILLHKGPIQLPSDVDGVVYLDITRGLRSALPELRRELKEWL
jgi:predicted nucleotide-binding protein